MLCKGKRRGPTQNRGSRGQTGEGMYAGIFLLLF